MATYEDVFGSGTQTPSQRAAQQVKTYDSVFGSTKIATPEAAQRQTVAPVVQETAPQQNFWDMAKQKVTDFFGGIKTAIDKAIPGGIAGGIERVKNIPAKELFFYTSSGFAPGREYIVDTMKLAVSAADGIAKLTPAYNLYRAALNDPVKPAEYAQNLFTTGMDSLGLMWRVQPEAPIAGYALNTWVGVRRYLQDRIDAKELVHYLDPSGINKTPSIGALITDNLNWAAAIDTVFMAAMITKPFATRALNKLNLSAGEINSAAQSLGVRPNATLDEVSAAVRQKIRSYPDAFTMNPDEVSMAARQQITNALNILKKAGVVEKNYAAAVDFIQGKLNMKYIPTKTEGAPKQLSLAAPADVGQASAGTPADNTNRMVAQYRSYYGDKLLNADNVRELFAPEGYNRVNSADYHDKASTLTNAIFKQDVAALKPGDKFLFTAGSSGAGKSSALALYPDITKDLAGGLDGNFSSSGSIEKLGQVIAKGADPTVAFFYREPIDAWTNGIIKRAANPGNGRVVPMEVFLDNLEKSPKTVLAAKEKFGDKVDVEVIDNSLGKSKAALVSNPIDFLKKIKYDIVDVKKQIIDITVQKINDGTLSPAAGKALLGRFYPEARSLIEQGSKSGSAGAITLPPTADNKFYVNTGATFTEVPGKSVPIVPGIDTFIHQADGKFVVSESVTGAQVATGLTENEAIFNARKALSGQLPQAQKSIQTALDEGKQSPRFKPAEKAVVTKEKSTEKNQEFNVGDVLDPQGNTNMEGQVTIRAIEGNTLKFTDSKGTDFAGMQKSLVRDLVNGGSWKKVTTLTKDIKDVSGDFRATVEPLVKKYGLSDYRADEYKEFKTALTTTKDAGYAIKPSGDLVSVFNTDGKGNGVYAVIDAIENGAKKLDSYDGKLVDYYSQFGFEEYKREPNWTAGQPDVVYQKLNPQKYEQFKKDHPELYKTAVTGAGGQTGPVFERNFRSVGSEPQGTGKENIQNPPEPKVTPESKPSKIAKSIEAKAVEAKLTTGFSDLAEYSPTTIKAQSKMATDLVNSDIEKARSMVRGETPLPDNLKGVSLITAMEEVIKKNPSGDLAYELANSPLVTGTSTAAQELRLAAEREPDSITARLQTLKDAKMKAAEKKTGKPAKQAVADEIVKIKKQVKIPDKYDWSAFVASLEC